MTQKLWTAALAASLMLSTTMVHGEVNLNHPTFLEAATTVLSGAELPPNIQTHPTQLFVSERNIFDNDMRVEQISYQVSSADPCMILQQQTVPPYLFRAWNFNNMPGPQSVQVHFGPALPFGAGTVWQAQNDGPFVSEKTDHIVPGSDRKITSGFLSLRQPIKQLAALQYIRDNFCPGQPEAPVTINPY